MSQAVDYLYKKYDNLENHIQGLTQPSTVIEQTLVDLISFFKSPDTQIFNVNNLYLSLKDEDLFNAINAITIFFMNDSGNITDGKNIIIPDLIREEKILYSTMLSKYLIENGFESFTPQKVIVYAKRKMDNPSFNKIPQPDFYAGKKPYWFESTAAEFVEENKDNKK